jgi:hypothetical protein
MERVTTWYQVYCGSYCYGFKADAVKILDHPERRFIGMTLEEFKRIIPSLGIKQITKISDVYESDSN